MPTFKQSIRINATPAKVWYVLSHAGEFDLQSSDTREEITSTKREGVGTMLRVVRRIGPIKIVLDGRMTEWKDACEMASEWSSGLPFMILTRVRMTCTPVQNATRLDREYTVAMNLPLLGKIGELFLTRNTPGDMQGLLERIKLAAENEKGR